jgi:hypothetical protein
MTFRACSSPAPTRVKLQPAPAILSQESVHTTLSITNHTRKRPSTVPRTTHGPHARRRLLRLRNASRCLGTSRGSSCRSSSTTPPRAGSSSTTSPPPRIQAPPLVARHVTRLVAPLVLDYSASRRLVVDYFASAARPGASARHAARDAAHRAARRRLHRVAQARRRLLRLAQARRRLLRLRRTSGCLGTSRGSSRGSPCRSS